MRYVVMVFEVPDDVDTGLEKNKVYEQTISDLDMRAVMQAVNKRPRKSRAKAKQDDAK